MWPAWHSNYGLTYNCINHFENQKTFNDGYHITHHVTSHLHWREMPLHFIRNIDRWIEDG